MIDYFHKFVPIGLSDSCWEWQGGRFWSGYGVFNWDYNHYYAHRVGWTIANGEIPIGMVVCHKCDNPQCINVNHMFLGTPQDNARDRESKGRSNTARGSRTYRAKLNETQVKEIRQLKADHPELTMKQIAHQFGVGYGAIYKILKRESWTHVEAN